MTDQRSQTRYQGQDSNWSLPMLAAFGSISLWRKLAKVRQDWTQEAAQGHPPQSIQITLDSIKRIQETKSNSGQERVERPKSKILTHFCFSEPSEHSRQYSVFTQLLFGGVGGELLKTSPL